MKTISSLDLSFLGDKSEVSKTCEIIREDAAGQAQESENNPVFQYLKFNLNFKLNVVI